VAIFPGKPGLAGTRTSPFWILLGLRVKSRLETFWYRLIQVHLEK